MHYLVSNRKVWHGLWTYLFEPVFRYRSNNQRCFSGNGRQESLQKTKVMKTNTFFRIALAVAVSLTASNLSFGQRQHRIESSTTSGRTTRSNQAQTSSRVENRSETQPVAQQRNESYEQKNRDNANYRPQENRHNNAAQHNGHNNNQYSNKKGNGNGYGHNGHAQKNYGHKEYAHNDYNHNNHGHNNYERPRYKHNNYGHQTYMHRLPAQCYNRYVFNGVSYYNCDDRFFTHHPDYGYVQVETPYVVVNSLPRYYSFRHNNGHRMIFANGYFFVPMAHGWMMVPEPVAPVFSFNIQIGH